MKFFNLNFFKILAASLLLSFLSTQSEGFCGNKVYRIYDAKRNDYKNNIDFLVSKNKTNFEKYYDPTLSHSDYSKKGIISDQVWHKYIKSLCYKLLYSAYYGHNITNSEIKEFCDECTKANISTVVIRDQLHEIDSEIFQKVNNCSYSYAVEHLTTPQKGERFYKNRDRMCDIVYRILKMDKKI